MDKQTLIKEKENLKKKITLFSCLTGGSITLAVISLILMIVFEVLMIEAIVDEIAGLATSYGVLMVISIIFLVLFILACLAFTPFIVINSIKYGKRRRLLKKIEREEPQLV